MARLTGEFSFGSTALQRLRSQRESTLSSGTRIIGGGAQVNQCIEGVRVLRRARYQLGHHWLVSLGLRCPDRSHVLLLQYPLVLQEELCHLELTVLNCQIDGCLE